MDCVLIPRSEAQAAVERLKEAGALRDDRRIIEDGNLVIIPVLRKGAEDAGFDVVHQHDTPARNGRTTPFERICESLGLQDEKADLLPRKWELLGDVLVLDLDPGLSDNVGEVAKATLGYPWGLSPCASGIK